jgi:hypothetical protein
MTLFREILMKKSLFTIVLGACVLLAQPALAGDNGVEDQYLACKAKCQAEGYDMDIATSTRDAQPGQDFDCRCVPTAGEGGQ